MGGQASDPAPEFEGVEPGSPGDHFVRAVTEAATALATIAQHQMLWDSPHLRQRLDEVEQKIDALSEKLDNFVKVLNSVSRDAD